MKEIETTQLFDLSSFKHAKLFERKLYPWEVLLAIEDYFRSLQLGKIDAFIPEGVTLVHPELISIGAGTLVEPGAYIAGPCVIGEGCQIRQGAYIRGQFIAGNKCVIGHTTEVKNSVFLDGVQAAHFSYVGDSILGNKVNLGAGTKLANLKFDHQSVVLFVEGKRLDSGLKKFGAMIGDGAQLGCNAVTNPGTIIGKGAFWYPCVNHGGIIPAKAVVKPSTAVTVSV